MQRSLSQFRRLVQPLLRTLLVLLLIYFFLMAITLLSGTFKALGKGQAETMIQAVSNPFAALSIGILATVLVQSSSVVTSTIVATMATFAAGKNVSDPEVLRGIVAPFIPMVMGANIGTTITNTLASLACITRKAEFERAFAGATIHDFFNLLTVLVLLPLDMLTGYLSHLAVWAVQVLHLSQNLVFKSPLKALVKGGAHLFHLLAENLLGLPKGSTGWAIALLLLSLLLIFISLVYITKNMKHLLASNLERAINRVLERNAMVGILTGLLVTVAVQSSSITTSIMVPMFAAGLLSLEGGFPIMMGANVGTTVTALLAAVATGPAGLAIAFSHLFFNITGIILIYPLRPIRRIPILLAERLARRCIVNRWWVLAYVLGVFVSAPLLGMLIFS